MHKELESGERWALLDCDDVLLDYIEGFSFFLSQRLGRPVVGRPQSWALESWIGVDANDVLPLMNAFNDTDEGFGQLKAIQGAVEGVLKLRDLGFKIAIITSSSGDPVSKARREHNVTAIFGNLIDDLHIVNLGQSKSDILQSYTNAIWVEDNVKNAHLGARCGHRAFLLLASHNQDVHGKMTPKPGVVHAQSWADIVDRVADIMPQPISVVHDDTEFSI